MPNRSEESLSNKLRERFNMRVRTFLTDMKEKINQRRNERSEFSPIKVGSERGRRLSRGFPQFIDKQIKNVLNPI